MRSNESYVVPSIEVHDGLAAYLGGPGEVERFSLSILDVARLSGHLCPSVAGAYLVTRAAVLALFPDTKVCERGLLTIDVPGAETDGANGPIGHVMSYITGAWPESGFAGLRGEFARRNLLRYNSKKVQIGHYRFQRLDTGAVVEISYFPNKANVPASENASFGEMWQTRVKAILNSPDVIEVHRL